MLDSATVIYSLHMLKHFFVRRRIPSPFLISL